MTKTLELVFELTNGKTLTLSVASPKDNLTQGTINSAMDAIVSADVFSREGQTIVAKKSARIVERAVTDIVVV